MYSDTEENGHVEEDIQWTRWNREAFHPGYVVLGPLKQ